MKLCVRGGLGVGTTFGETGSRIYGAFLTAFGPTFLFDLIALSTHGLSSSIRCRPYLFLPQFFLLLSYGG